MSKKFLSLLLILTLSAGFAQAYVPLEKVQASDSTAIGLPKSTNSLQIITNSLKNGEANSPYSETLRILNGVSPYKWSESGKWPAGLILNTKTGLISGKPNQSGGAAKEYSFIIKVTDSAPGGKVQTVSKTFTLTIYPPLAIGSLPNADAGSPYFCYLPASGGKPPYSWVKGTAWPAWLTLDSSTNALSGAHPIKGTFNFGLRLIDSLGYTAAKTLTVIVNNPLTILTTFLPNGEPGLTYPTTILQSSGGASTKVWSKIAGVLPSGLSLSPSGIIRGKPGPGSSGVYAITLQITDGIAIVNKNFILTIYNPLVIDALPDGLSGTAYTHILSAEGGSAGYVFSVAGALPDWLNFNEKTAVLSGTPVNAGTYILKLKVADKLNGSTIQNLALKIASGGGDPVVSGDYDIGTPTLTDLWVDPVHGKDTNNGASRQDALRTITAAWNRIPAGTTLSSTGYRLQLVSGSYPLDFLPSYMEDRHGDRQFPVILNAVDGTGTALLTGGPNIFNCEYLYLIGLTIVPDPAGDAIHFECCNHILLKQVVLNSNGAAQETFKANQCSYIYVEDCDVSGSYGTALDFVAVQHGHILRSRIHNAGDWCMYLKGGSAYFLIEGNELYDGETGGFTAGQGTGFEFMVSPWLHYEAYDIKFINNIVHDTGGAGMGVNGGYNILLAYNTLYRIGQRSHAIEVTLGLRACDGDSTICRANLAAGGWGTITPGREEPIPNRNVFIYNNLIYNPPGFRSQWNQFAIPGPQTPSQGTNIPSPATADANLQIRGNIIFNGPPDLPLGVGEPDQGGQPSNPTCNATLLRTQNSINIMQPQLVDPAGGDFRPITGSNVLSYLAAAVPDFTWTDAPNQPPVAAGQLGNSVFLNRNRTPRTTPSHPGAY